MKKIVLLLSLFVSGTTAAFAQNKEGNQSNNAKTDSVTGPVHLDFVTSPPTPGGPQPGTVPNQQLLQPAGTAPSIPYRTTQNTPTNGVSPVNANTTNFNLGNKKGSNTIYYDNTGKVSGSNTTIQLGGK